VAEQLCGKKKLYDIFMPYGCQSFLGMLKELIVSIGMLLNADKFYDSMIFQKVFFMFLILIAHYLNCMKLAVECGVGIAVFVRCFTDKTAIEDEIAEKLGYGLSLAPFATIVVSAILLFFFFSFVSLLSLCSVTYIVAAVPMYIR
jgi:hypothetical protein